MQVHSQSFATGFQVAQHGRALADALEIVDGPFHACAVRNRQKVQYRIGGAAGGHDHGHGVFNGLAGHDVAWLDAFADGFHQNAGRLFGRLDFFVVHVGHGGGVGQGDAQRLESRRHGVGGVHAAARTRAGDGALFDLEQVIVAQLACGIFAHGFKHAHDVQVFALVAARQNGAAVNVDGRNVGAQHAHQAAGHVLVATAHHQHAVHPLALHAGFHAVGNHLAGDQRVLHALGAHGHAVRDGGGAKDLGVATGGFDALNGGIGQLLQAAVARGDGAVPVGHAHHGFDEIALFIAHGVVHRPVGGAGFALGDVGAAAVDGGDRDDFVAHGGVSVEAQKKVATF